MENFLEPGQIHEFRFSPSDINVTEDSILKSFGYKDSSVASIYKDIIKEVLSAYRRYADFKGGFRIFPVEFLEKNSFTINNIKFNSGRIITTHLRKISYAAFFIATAGKSLEEWSRDLMKDDLLKGYIVDSFASEAVEAVCDLLEQKLLKILSSKGLNITNRYSPGYCEWDVSEQRKLFSLLPENFCNVRLTDSSLMNPIKSVSGIIGIGETVKRENYKCNVCGMENCYKRKV